MSGIIIGTPITAHQKTRTGENNIGKRKMSDTITITFMDGTKWKIHRSVIERLGQKSEDELLFFFKRFNGWFESWEKDVLGSLVRMEREGLIIDNNINLKYR